MNIRSFDERRNLFIANDSAEAATFCAEHFIRTGNESIAARGVFTVALSGGSTPKAVFQLLASPIYKDRIDWKKVKLFWSDERCVAPTNPESNYHMAMTAGFSSLPIPDSNIFRMPADSDDLKFAAKKYEIEILENTIDGVFDLVMLGMGDDGHTASLFPETHGLHVDRRLVIPNYVPQKDTVRMTFTFDCINSARHIIIYAFGKGKTEMIERVLNGKYNPDHLPIQRVGTPKNKALFVILKAD